ncbi:MAG TPA: PadR family transcriptional regulator [Galbitalea sp.]|jgi:DNA-binding PadR family transcriptional regulator
MSTQEMREPTFFVLASLADGRKHGYGIIKDAEELSDGRVRLKVGTLYAALERLTAEGLVEAAGDEVVDGRARRYFVLTDSGTASLAAEAERQALNAARARARLTQRAAKSAVTTPKAATA